MSRPIARPAPRRIGPRARGCIMFFEACRLRAYRCSAGKWTIGWGNTFYEDGRAVRAGDVITRERAEQLFENLLPAYERAVEAALQGAPASAAQFGALVSLGWNIGTGALRGSTLIRLHNAGQYAAAADQFPRWNRSAGQVTFGLVRRRAVERLLYLNDLDRFDEQLRLRRAGRDLEADRLAGVSR
ncbi:MAG: lysozyme [Sphingomonadaceae bacterium]